MALRNLSQIGRKVFEVNCNKTSSIFVASIRNIKQGNIPLLLIIFGIIKVLNLLFSYP